MTDQQREGIGPDEAVKRSLTDLGDTPDTEGHVAEGSSTDTPMGPDEGLRGSWKATEEQRPGEAPDVEGHGKLPHDGAQPKGEGDSGPTDPDQIRGNWSDRNLKRDITPVEW